MTANPQTTPTPRVGARDTVTLRLPAQSAYVAVLRTAAAGLASRLNFTLDDIEDLRIAVDEACAMLLPRAAAGAQLECAFEVSGDELDVAVSLPTNDGVLPSRDTFSWTVLTALADSVDASAEGTTVTITMAKRSSAAR